MLYDLAHIGILGLIVYQKMKPRDNSIGNYLRNMGGWDAPLQSIVRDCPKASRHCGARFLFSARR